MEGALLKSRSKARHFVMMATALASLASLLLGYDIGVMSGAILFIEEHMHLSTMQVQIIVASLNLVSAVGAIIGGRAADALGRRKSIAISSIVFCAGAIWMAVADSFGTLLGGRLLTGLAVGAGLVIAPLYTAELAPAEIRGRLVAMMEVFINVGILLGYISGFAFEGLSSDVNWRWMLGLGGLPAFILLLSVACMAESPRWLLSVNRNMEAEAVLARLSDNEDDLRNRLADIRSTLELERNAADKGSWKQVLCPQTAGMKRVMLIVLGVNFFTQATGIEAAVYYTPQTLKAAGITNAKQLLGATIGVGVAKTICILIAAPLLDRYGRRRMLLISSAGLAISLALLGLSFSLGSPVALALTAQILFVSSFSIGYGPASYIISSEITPLRVRGRAMSLGTLLNRLVSGTIALTFLSIADAVTTAGAFYGFMVIALMSYIFVYVFVFETKGRSLEDIEQQLKLGMHHNDNEHEHQPAPIPLSADEIEHPSSSSSSASGRTYHHGHNSSVTAGLVAIDDSSVDINMTDAELVGGHHGDVYDHDLTRNTSSGHHSASLT